LRCIISGDNRDVLEMLPEEFKNKYFITYLFVLWFGIFPWCMYYYQLPEYGIWSYLLSSNFQFGCIILGIVIILAIAQLVVLYKERDR
jgi:hypothetical protein